MWIVSYGNPSIRALTVASGPFLKRPPAGFSEHPLLIPRGVLFVGRDDQRPQLEEAAREGQRLVPEIRLIDPGDACRQVPALRPELALPPARRRSGATWRT